MLQFKIDSIAERIILTLTEMTTVSGPIFVFTFTHTVTKDVVTFTKTIADDFSNYPNRYNEFAINPSVLFSNKSVGEWQYKITEQQTNKILEYGKLILLKAVEFSFISYNTPTTFITYNG